MPVEGQWQNCLSAVGRDFGFQFFDLDLKVDCFLRHVSLHFNSLSEEMPVSINWLWHFSAASVLAWRLPLALH